MMTRDEVAERDAFRTASGTRCRCAEQGHMTAPSDFEALVEKAEDAVADAMIEHGPDGHTDGADLIARAALEAIGLPALLERVEAAEHGRTAMTTTANEVIAELAEAERDRDALAAKVADAGERIALAIEQSHDEWAHVAKSEGTYNGYRDGMNHAARIARAALSGDPE